MKDGKHTQEQDIVVAPEGHDNTRGLIERNRLDVAQTARLPNTNLPVTHPAKPGRRDPILVTHPHYSRAFDPTMSIRGPDRVSSSSRIEYPQLTIPARRHYNLASRIERKTLDCISVSAKNRLW